MSRSIRQKPGRPVNTPVKPGLPARGRLTGLLLVLAVLLGVAVFVWMRPIQQERALRAASLEQLTELSRRAPSNGRAFYYLGLRRREQGDLAGARDAFEQAGLHGVDDEEAWLAWAASTESLQDDQATVSILRTFTKTHPNSARSHKALALLYRRWGNLTLTYEEALTAANLVPQDTEAWRLAGSAAFGGPNTPKAKSEAAYREAVKQDPADWRNVQGLGQVLAAEGNDAAASECYRKASALAPAEPDPAVSLGVILLKRAVSPPQRETARQALLVATKLAPASGPAWYCLGKAYCDDGQYALARPALEHAARFSPDDPKVHYALWTVYQRLGDRIAAAHEAAQHAQLELDSRTKYKLQSNVHDHPNDTAARLILARFCVAHGDYSRAAYEYRHVIARDPGQVIAQREFAALQQKQPHIPDASTFGMGHGSEGGIP